MQTLFNFTLDATSSFGFGNVLSLFCGLALFLFGMDFMGDSLKKSAGSSLKAILGKMTSNPFKGFLLGLGVTAIIQSSSATTVMVVGFVNSGTMTLIQAVGVILGANVGTAVTSWLTAMSGLGNMDSGTSAILKLLKPDSWMPVLAVIGICLNMFVKRGRKKDIGAILLGFSVLMVGMELMGDAVGPLKDNEAFKEILVMFKNPILGILAGLVLTAIVQSSSASVGILQSLTVTGAITWGAAIPIVMGQNIGTCVTAMLSSIGAGKEGKRAAYVHLLFNVIAVSVVGSLFYLLNWILSFAFVPTTIDMWGVAICHTVFKLISVSLIGPFYKQLAKLACLIVKDTDEDDKTVSMLDDRLLDTPAVAVQAATKVAYTMAEVSARAFNESLSLLDGYDAKLASDVRDLEGKADNYEDNLGSYLVKASSYNPDQKDSEQITMLLHIIGDFERISDHAVNIVESAEEIKEKKLTFSDEATKELSALRSAVEEIVDLAIKAFMNNDLECAAKIEPLEQVVDDLRDRIKLNHIKRLQKSECTIGHGFVLSDLLTNYERVADHCSNVAGCVIEISRYDALDMHKYMYDVRHGSEEYDSMYKAYSRKYSLDDSLQKD